MSNTLSPNMSLVIPGVGTEAGPQYAVDVNASLTILDSHNHSPGSGVQITPSGLNINTSLTFNGNTATNLQALSLLTQATNTTLNTLYAKLGSEPTPVADLWYNDSAGNAVQLTSNGTVNATLASIPGESYGGGTFTWRQGAGSTTPANFDIGGITIRPTVAATTFGVTITPPAAISSAYSLVLPPLPSSQKIMTLDASGNITAPYTVDGTTIAISSNVIGIPNGAIGTSQIADNSVTTAKIPDGDITTAKLNAVSTSIASSGSGNFSTTSTTLTSVSNQVVNYSSSTGNVMVYLAPDPAFFGGANLKATSGSAASALFAVTTLSGTILAEFALQSSGTSIVVPPGSITTPIFGIATVGTLVLKASAPSGASTAFVTNCKLVIVELR